MKTEDRVQFAEEMARTSLATQSDIGEEHYDVYWDALNLWQLDDFQAAMKECRNDLNRFPSVAQIRERRPKSHAKAADVIYGNLMAIEEKSDARGPESLESELDGLSREELVALVRRTAPYDSDATMDEAAVVKACGYIADSFKRNPQSGCYRPYMREALTKLKQATRNGLRRD